MGFIHGADKQEFYCDTQEKKKWKPEETEFPQELLPEISVVLSCYYLAHCECAQEEGQDMAGVFLACEADQMGTKVNFEVLPNVEFRPCLAKRWTYWDYYSPIWSKPGGDRWDRMLIKSREVFPGFDLETVQAKLQAWMRETEKKLNT